MFKKHMVPLTPKGQTIKHAGKGSQQSGMPDRNEIKQLSAPGSTMNNYAKASPTPQAAGMPAPPMGDYGLG